MKQRFIGEKKIRQTKETGEKTPGGQEIIEVVYDDLSVEHFSKVMFDKIVDANPCNTTELRDKRVRPVLDMCLVVIRDWGLKIGELNYLSLLLNQSLNYNTDQAQIKLWSQYMPTPQSLDDINYLVVDRVLKSFENKKKIEDVGK